MKIACVDVPSLALQLVLEQNPGWGRLPVVVVDRDVAQGTVLHANREATRSEIRPGMSYAAALSLHRDLRAAVVTEDELAQTQQKLVEHLLLFSPHVEPSRTDPDLFWLRAAGLDRLFGSFDRWGTRLHDETRDLGFQTSISIGWTRFGTFATARASRVGYRLFGSETEERAALGQVPLAVLGLPPRRLAALEKLGIHRLSDFLALSSSGLRKRFGPEALELWNFAHGNADLPLQPLAVDRPIERTLDLEEPVTDTTRLLFILKRELHPMLMALANAHKDLAELDLLLRLEDGDEREVSVRPAMPTLEEPRLLDLVRLRLERTSLPAPIVRVELAVSGVSYRREQVHLFRRSKRRDPHAAEHALAKLGAEHGDFAVCRAELRPRHLPEETFELVPWDGTGNRKAEPAPPEETTVAIRRIYDRPLPLHRFDPDISRAWLIRDLDEGTVSHAEGPFCITDAWWTKEDFAARDYWLAHTTRGDVFWVFWDHLRKQWFLHGVLA